MSFSGIDRSGNENHWTPNNLAASDQMVDSPTNNFCTLNPLDDRTGGSLVYSEGNTSVTNSGGYWDNCKSTFGVSSGKWYWEVDFVSGLMTEIFNGIADTSINNSGTNAWLNGTVLWYNHSTSYLRVNGTNIGGYSQLPAGSILGLALDMDNKTLAFYGNGSLVVTHNIDSYITEATPYTLTDASTVQVHNFGQDATFAGNKSPSTVYDDGDYGSFFYQPPTGFKALCSQNLPDPAVKPGEHFNAVTYSGSSSDISVVGVGFQPNFVWVKRRSGVAEHELVDVVRGVSKLLSSDTTGAELDRTYFKSFDADGFSVETGVSNFNNPGDTYVAWNWKAGGTPVSNTSGSITSQVSANTAAGFSVVGWTGNNTAGATIGHGLSSAPEVIMVKGRSFVTSWRVYHTGLGSNTTTAFLNLAQAPNTGESHWNSTNPGSSVFTLGAGDGVNNLNEEHIAYCFHSVDGSSKIGSYIGNGNADGPFIYTGFQPKYVMVKNITVTTGAGNHWGIVDDARELTNLVETPLIADGTNAESSGWYNKDFLSNGFKIRGTNYAANYSGDTYIYMAFAEFPFKFSTAR